jgi:hypothetical protein
VVLFLVISIYGLCDDLSSEMSSDCGYSKNLLIVWWDLCADKHRN